MTTLRLATRGSDLALAQSRWVAGLVEEALGVSVELRTIRTSGDRLADVSLAEHGGKGLFIKEIEEALLADQADLAVHSAKDLPAELPDALCLAAFPERADARDALVSGGRVRALEDLPPGSVVGTGSARRGMWLAARFPELEIRPLRGNVPTRIAKMERGECDAAILACAGLDRLALSDRIDARIAPEVMLPAVGQGVVAVETRRAGSLADDLTGITDGPSAFALEVERAFLQTLGGDCNVPLAGLAQATREAGRWRFRGALGLPDGSVIHEVSDEGDAAAALGARAAHTLLDNGGGDVLAALRGDD